MIAELDCVALNADLPEHGLTVDDVGTVVHVFKDRRAFMVEFMTFEGETIALLKLSPNQIRPLARNEIHHTRPVEFAAR